jgi:ferritin-like metal-binding protein YciE
MQNDPLKEPVFLQGVGPATPRRRSMDHQTFKDLFEETLKDIYYAEKAILKALPKMAKKANSKKLQQAFTKHEKETEKQVERLEQVFELIGKRASGKDCPAIDGIIEEGEEVIKEAKDWQLPRPWSITRSPGMAR